MDRKLMYAFRGWIAFVAFMDLGTAVRSYIEKRSFLSHTMTDLNYIDDEYTTSRIIGIYSILKSIALIHCTLFIHYKSAVSMGACSIIVTIFMYVTETLYFRAATLNFYVIFPCVLNAITLAGLLYLPRHLKLWDPPVELDDEDTHFFKQANLIRRRRNIRKNT